MVRNMENIKKSNEFKHCTSNDIVKDENLDFTDCITKKRIFF